MQNKGLIESSSKQEEDLLCKAVVADAAELMSSIKNKRTTGAVQVRNKISAAMLGNNVKKMRMTTKAAKKLSVRKLTPKIKKEQNERKNDNR